MVVNVGDILTMKKQHPCGSKEFKVTRTGADFKLECCGCGHQLYGPRTQFQKSIKLINGEKVQK